MKLVTKIFILFEIVDIALTFFAIRLGLAYEINPNGFTIKLILAKFFVIILVAVCMEKVNFGKLVYLFPIIPILTVMWNILVIITSIFLASK